MFSLWIFGVSTDHAHWQPNPDGRGTSDILQTCVITLGLCVYSAIHLNIPKHRTTTLENAVNKIVWLLIALLAPEIIVYSAWFQRRDAKAITKALSEAHNIPIKQPWYVRFWNWLKCSRYQKISKRQVEEHEKYSMTHGFYFRMGGLVFDVSKDDQRVFPKPLDRLTLCPDFITWCLKNDFADMIPEVSAEEIADKSKANSLVKAFACIQAVWFCTQFVTRLVQGYPVSLLELNTFAHATCALLIYCLWWEKPLDVSGPTVIHTESDPRYRQLCAVAATAGFKGFHECYYPPGGLTFFDRMMCRLKIWERPYSDIDCFAYWSTRKKPEGNSDLSTRLLLPQPRLAWETPEFPAGSPAIERLQELLDQQYVNYTCYDPPMIVLRKGDFIPQTTLKIEHRSSEMDETALRRMQLQHQWATAGGHNKLPYCSLMYELPNSTTDSEIVNDRQLGIIGMTAPEMVGLIGSGLFYGGLHALAIGTRMPSHTEHMMWAISSITLLSGFPAFLILLTLFEILDRVGDPPKEDEAAVARKAARSTWILRLAASTLVAVAFVIIAVLLLYVLSRLFIIVEVFLALRHSDPRIYDTPDWSLYFPHIG